MAKPRIAKSARLESARLAALNLESTPTPEQPGVPTSPRK
jgi:hypothetical protein